jgi:hypothetical protein
MNPGPMSPIPNPAQVVEMTDPGSRAAPQRERRPLRAPRWGSARPTRTSWALTRMGIAMILGAVLLTGMSEMGAAAAPRPAGVDVLAIYQSNYTDEQENFTVSMEVANSVGVSFVYFTFCQLSNALCYLPVTMSAHGSGWFVGTTHEMTSYHGMTPGVRAGYNITIEYSNNTNVTEPSVPNPFGNLTVAQSVSGEYMYQMTVLNQTYGLSGTVKDSTTGAAISGAQVSLSPGNENTTTGSTGAYTFTGLFNGSYTLSIAEKGYTTTTQSVAIDGQSVANKDIPLSNGTTAPTGGGTKGSGSSSGTILGISTWTIVPVIGAIIALAAFLVLRRGRTPPAAPPPTAPSGSTPPPPDASK